MPADGAGYHRSRSHGSESSRLLQDGRRVHRVSGSVGAQLFGAAAVVVVMAFFGFKASQLMGAQATNNLKKIVESLQFFSLSLNMDIEWPGRCSTSASIWRR